ncbi:hypothetical protein CFII64_24134 [Pseudomonas sp. CFII64]|nr:hypothetical protein CFII64_24134 [Pseudomonas sp. CFII64]
MRFIQNLIRSAQSRLIIADPYLAGLQLGQYLYAVNGADIKVTLFTSNLAFNPKDKQTKLDRLNEFDSWIGKLSDHQKVQATVLILPPSVLHDRFLVVDDDVWFVGASLNALGDKASMIVKLPNPDEIIERLGSMQQQALSLASYIKKLSKYSGRLNEN